MKIHEFQSKNSRAALSRIARADPGDSETVIRQPVGRVVHEAPSLGVAVTGWEGSASQLSQLVVPLRDRCSFGRFHG